MENDDSIFDACDNEDCPAHHRVDVEDWDVEIQDYYAITYSGNYVVYTDANAVFDEPLMELAWRQMKGTPVPKWITRVIEVGPEGTLADLMNNGRYQGVMWFHEYTSFDMVWNGHHMVVSALEENLIDVSAPAVGRED
jgi:hypothetical protein